MKKISKLSPKTSPKKSSFRQGVTNAYVVYMVNRSTSKISVIYKKAYCFTSRKLPRSF